jgi:hypothetical protein
MCEKKEWDSALYLADGFFMLIKNLCIPILPFVGEMTKR